MSHRAPLALLAASFLIPAATLPTGALAQAARGGGASSRNGPSTMQQSQSRQSDVIVSVDFPGGSLTQWVAALTAAAKPDPANIVVRGPAEGVIVGPARLENVPISAALDVVSGEHQTDAGRYIVSAKEYQEAAGRSVFALQVIDGSRSRGANNQSPNREIAVLQIKELTTALPGDPPEAIVPAETILTAIETVLEVSEDNGNTDVKYHAPSGLVMLSGPIASLQAAQEVLSQLNRDVMMRRDRARQLQTSQGLDRPEQLERELAKAQAEMELAHVQMQVAANRHEVASDQLDEAKLLAEQGLASDNEISALKLRLIESQAEIEQGHIRAELEKQSVKQLQRSLDRARAIATGEGGSNEIDALRAENAMLRDRLAMMEAELAKLRELFAAQPIVTRPDGGTR